MSLRLKQITGNLNTWISVLALVATLFASVQSFVNTGIQKLEWFNDLPLWVRCFTIGLCALIAICSVKARRSKLLRPERFMIRTERPDQLFGRDDDLRSLRETCEKHRLVFLPGESGSGKSALVKAGLVSTCRDFGDSPKPRILPIYIDGSLLEWKDGLAIELTRELKQLTDEELADLGVKERPEILTLPDWLEELPVDATRELLIVIDQFDDYATRWKDRLIDCDGLVIDQKKMRQKNPDWRKIAGGIENDRLRVLFVCREDMQWALSTVRFEDPAEIPPLSRLGESWVHPMLDRLTDDDGKGETVRDADCGWEKLKKRLLRDLSANGGKVLAVQLVVAVEGLQHLRRFLTEREYEGCGGLTGLEQLRVKEQIVAAARCGSETKGIVWRDLLRAIEGLLVTKDGLKTQRASLQDLATAVLGLGANPEQMRPAVAHLESKRILRRRTSADGSEELMLYHDFLARGIREAWLRLNGSHELLRQHSQELEEADGWLERWKALLSLKEQTKLGWARLRGRIRYGTHRRLAFLSVVRVVPLVVLLALLGMAAWQYNLSRERRAAESCLIAIGEMNVSADELRNLTRLCGLSEQARLYSLRFGLVQKPENIEKRAAWMVRAVAGLDPDGRIQQRIGDEILAPLLEESKTYDSREKACLTLLGSLRLRSQTQIATILVKHMKTEQNADGLSILGNALSGLSVKIEVSELRPVALALIERMKTEQNASQMNLLANALSGMIGKLDADDLRPGALVLLGYMKNEIDSNNLCVLGEPLSKMGTLINDDELRPFASTLLDRMKDEQIWISLWHLQSVLSSMIAALDRNELLTGAGALIERMKTEKDPSALIYLGNALVEISANLNADDTQPGVVTLVERMKTEEDHVALWYLGDTASRMATNLDVDDLRPLAVALVQCINTEEHSDELCGLGLALCGISARLDAKDLRPLAAKLIERMTIEKDTYAVYGLGKALSAMSANLDAVDIRPGAAVLIECIESKQKEDDLVRLGKALSGMSAKLEVNELRPPATTLVKAMEAVDNPYDYAKLLEVWLPLNLRLVPHPSNRMQELLNILQLPKAIPAQKAILKHIEQFDEVKPTEFNGSVWRLVEWIETTEKGKSLNLNLDYRPH